jgi:arylformamidase
MRIYDISLPISPELPVWPGDPSVVLERFARIEDGETANVSRIAMGVHTGTHVDAPYHFLADGSKVEHMQLKILIGRAYVVHLPEADVITAEVLQAADIPPRTRRLLFKTRNSNHWSNNTAGFQKDFVALSADGANYLVERGVRLVGVDYLSVAPFDAAVPTHQILLRSEVIIVEGLNLSQVAQGRYTLYCLPLFLKGAEGAPARAILVGV